MECLLGTDQIGRDVLSRILVACRTAAMIALTMALIALLVGIPMFILRVSLDRARDSTIQYWVEGALEGLVAVPWLVIGILIVVKLGSSMGMLYLALSVMLIPRALRVGWSMGASERLEVMNVVNIVLRQGTLFLAAAVVISTALGFLGLGVPPPIPDLGAMVGDSRNYLGSASWLVVYPGIVLSIVVGTWLLVAALLSRSGPEHHSVRWSHIMSYQGMALGTWLLLYVF